MRDRNRMGRISHEEYKAIAQSPRLARIDEWIDEHDWPRPIGYRASKPTDEFMFARAELGRYWRFDRAWPEWKVAFEYEGNVGARDWARSDHTKADRYTSDCEKYSWAALMGWIVVRATPEMVDDGRAFVLLDSALHAGKERTTDAMRLEGIRERIRILQEGEDRDLWSPEERMVEVGKTMGIIRGFLV